MLFATNKINKIVLNYCIAYFIIHPIKEKKMTKYDEKVLEFHKVMELPINVPFETKLLDTRKTLLQEEMAELFAEIDNAKVELAGQGSVSRAVFENMCKEMADIQYALSGLAVSFGLPFEQAFDLTHESNMSKLGADGKPIRREDGKIMKGPLYHKPDLSCLQKKTD